MEQGFFAMGGYAVYVWPCYALTAAILLGFLVTSLRDLRARERRLRALEAQRGMRRGGEGPGTRDRGRRGPDGATVR